MKFNKETKDKDRMNNKIEIGIRDGWNDLILRREIEAKEGQED